jgi:ribosomal protein S12 methylthiotransferase accessory factor
VRTARDPRLELVTIRLGDRGYRARIYDTTTELGLPTVWTLVERVDGGDDLQFLCGAGGGTSLERAAWSALVELVTSLEGAEQTFRAQREVVERMQDEPSLIAEMDDHLVAAGHERTRERLAFLLEQPDLVPFPDAFDPAFPSHDVTALLDVLVARVRAEGMDVVVIDQTTAELHDAGLVAMKVHVPGTLPMTFGANNRRIAGSTRLARRRTGPIEPFPHPFP